MFDQGEALVDLSCLDQNEQNFEEWFIYPKIAVKDNTFVPENMVIRNQIPIEVVQHEEFAAVQNPENDSI